MAAPHSQPHGARPLCRVRWIGGAIHFFLEEHTHACTAHAPGPCRDGGRSGRRGPAGEVACTGVQVVARVEGGARAHLADQHQHRDPGAARVAARRGTESRAAGYRIPEGERQLQEGRRPDEREGFRREDVPEAEADAHDRREGGRQLNAGFSLLELLFAVAIAGTLAATAVPQGLRSLDDFRTRSAARYLAQRAIDARFAAIKRSTVTGLRFEAASPDYRITSVADGNG